MSEEIFSNIRTVKAFHNEPSEIAKYREINRRVVLIGKRRAVWSGIFQFISYFILYGTLVGIVYIGCIDYMNGNGISTSVLTGFLFLLLMACANIVQLALNLGPAFQIYAAADRVKELMDEPVTRPGTVKPQEKPEGKIEFKGVDFSYPKHENVKVLKNVSLSADSNKKVVALVGTSGCGKSSIISLIEQFYQPGKGQVLFNDVDVSFLDPKWYHSQVAIVQQEPVLFSGDIRSNIFYGFDTAPYTEPQLKKMLDEACQSASAYDFIHDERLFPLGYGTVVGERGLKLSGGQKQRIAIARALVRKPKLLLLDEATSALDAESEYQVQRALDNLIKSGQFNVVVVAHRLSTIVDADEIVVM